MTINDRVLKISLEAGVNSYKELFEKEKEKKEPNTWALGYYEGALLAYKSALKDLEWQRRYEAEKIEEEMRNENHEQVQSA